MLLPLYLSIFAAMEKLTFQYPVWYLALCLLVGAAISLFLYFRDTTFKEQPRVISRVLGVLRFLVVSLICSLLLTPLLKSLLLETQNPIVVFAQDNSESVKSDLQNDSEIEAYQSSVQSLWDQLAKNYELKQFVVGSDVRAGEKFDFSDKVTNLSAFLSQANDLFSNQNLGAIILSSDGIYNEGANPLYLNTRLNVPIYTIALGDTTPQKDAYIKRVFHNKIAYLGDRFTVQVDISAKNLNGATTQLRVSKVEAGGTRQLSQIPISYNSYDHFFTQELTLEADKPGVQRFRISLGQVAGESSSQNNVKDIFIDVLDARQKILILANAAHPDLTALKQTLEVNKNYEATISYAESFTENPADYDFVILHQLPSFQSPVSNVLEALNAAKTPRMFVLGSQSDIRRFNQVQPLLTINGDNRSANEVQAKPASNFSLFQISEELRKEILSFAPLQAPFGEFVAGGNAQVLLYQRIGRVDTDYPLVLMGEQNGVKTGIICAEGLWKWRLFDFLQNQNHDLFEELIGKSSQYVSLKQDKRRFRVNQSKSIFAENEPVLFDAELYNESYELVNEPDATITITNEENRQFNFTFNKLGQGYELNAGVLAPGGYSYKASVTYNNQTLEFLGQFSVEPIQIELYETTADHNLLRQLSGKFGGTMVYPNQIQSLNELIMANGSVKPVIYQTSKTRPLIHLKWIFALLFFLLAAEWFLRRYFGTY